MLFLCSNEQNCFTFTVETIFKIVKQGTHLKRQFHEFSSSFLIEPNLASYKPSTVHCTCTTVWRIAAFSQSYLRKNFEFFDFFGTRSIRRRVIQSPRCITPRTESYSTYWATAYKRHATRFYSIVG